MFEAVASEYTDFNSHTKILTTLYTSLVIRSLAQSRTRGSGSAHEDIIKKGSEYLRSQKSQYWTWNYQDKQEGQSPYPDDLDDTFLAVTALCGADRAIINGEALAMLVKNLIGCEAALGGPYRTWCVSSAAESVWHDVDAVVNANIGGFLAMHDVVVPAVDALIEQTLRSNTRSYSPYYPTPYSFWYFIAPWYRGKKEILIKKIMEDADKNGGWNGNPLDTALCMNALLQLGARHTLVSSGFSYILSSEANELCRPYVFAVERITETETYYSGSAAFSAAVIYEAILRYEKAVEMNNKKSQTERDSFEDRLYQKIQDEVKSTSKASTEAVCRSIESIAQHPQTRAGCLLGYYAWNACVVSEQSTRNQLTPDNVLRYGIAALRGSIAYKIYDDFFDEQGNVDALTLAGRSNRALAVTYATASPAVRELFLYVTEAMDASQEWEEKNCRIEKRGDYFVLNTVPKYGRYEVLAQKSCGLVLAPAAVLIEDGHNPESALVQSIIDFCSQYLIARQLSDDGHDWQQDLRAGKLNSVSAALATKYLEVGSVYHTEDTIEHLAKLFWCEDIKELSTTILFHTAAASRIATTAPGIYHPEYLLRILEPLEDAANQAIAQAATITDFLSEYKKEE